MAIALFTVLIRDRRKCCGIEIARVSRGQLFQTRPTAGTSFCGDRLQLRMSCICITIFRLSLHGKILALSSFERSFISTR